MFILTFENDENINGIYKIREILKYIVEIQPLRITNLIPQCQGYGNTQNYCGKQPRCVKCALSHLTKDCPKQRNSTPTCCNC